MTYRIDDCRFCSYWGPGGAVEDPVFDEPVLQNEAFVVIPALGTIVTGYVLIVPRNHFLSMSQIPGPERIFLREVISSVAVATAPHGAVDGLLVYEHGDNGSGQRARPCIEHAHAHVLPSGYGLGASFERSLCRRADAPASIADLERDPGEDYHYLSYGGRASIYFDCRLGSQYMRKQLASRVGVQGHWDWAIEPLPENAARTRALFDSRTSSIDSDPKRLTQARDEWGAL
ncbi:MAG: hypothetical protein GY788_02820 [bacterium]|nr:hypothetical protein [bacterium]